VPGHDFLDADLEQLCDLRERVAGTNNVGDFARAGSGPDAGTAVREPETLAGAQGIAGLQAIHHGQLVYVHARTPRDAPHRVAASYNMHVRPPGRPDTSINPRGSQ